MYQLCTLFTKKQDILNTVKKCIHTAHTWWARWEKNSYLLHKKPDIWILSSAAGIGAGSPYTQLRNRSPVPLSFAGTSYPAGLSVTSTALLVLPSPTPHASVPDKVGATVQGGNWPDGFGHTWRRHHSSAGHHRWRCGHCPPPLLCQLPGAGPSPLSLGHTFDLDQHVATSTGTIPAPLSHCFLLTAGTEKQDSSHFC